MSLASPEVKRARADRDHHIDLREALRRMPTPPPRSPSASSCRSTKDRDRRSSSASASSARTLSQRYSMAPPLSPPLPQSATAMSRSSSERERLTANPRTLSEELGGVEYPFDKFESPRTSTASHSLNSTPGSTSAQGSKRRSSDGRNMRRKSRVSTGPSGPTLFIAAIAQEPSGASLDSIGSDSSAHSRRSGSHLSLEDWSPVPLPLQPADVSSRAATSKASRPASVLALCAVRQFFVDLARALSRIASEVGWPLLCALVRLFTGGPSPASSHAGPSAPAQTALDAVSLDTTSRNAFAEKFKYILCTSFLLTPSLSISFYDSTIGPRSTRSDDEGGGAEDVAKEEARIVAESMPSGAEVTRPIRTLVTVSPDGRIAKPEPTSTGHKKSSLPTLHGSARQLRNATVLALLALIYYSPSVQAWSRTALLIIALSWPLVVTVLSLGSDSSQELSFEVLESPKGQACSAALLSLVQRRQMHSRLLSSASRLVESARDADRGFNKTIAAIQEVELVARGFKITHPLPPISRIEAASTSLAASPTRPRGTSFNGVVTPTPGAKVARTLSGASTDSNAKHAGSSKGIPDDACLTNSSAKRVEPRRMASLRRNLVQVFEEASQTCRKMLDGLEPLADAEELASLREMYALDGLSSNVNPDGSLLEVLTPGPGEGDVSRGPSPSFGSFYPDELGIGGSHKRASWTMTTPRNLGSKRSSLVTSPNTTAFDDSGIATSPRASTSQKHFSLTSEASSIAGGSSSLSRSGSALRRGPVRPDSASSDNGAWVGDRSEATTPTTGGIEGRTRGSRLSYIAEGSNSSGPNGSSAAKRLSYQGSDSRPGSRLSSRGEHRESLDLSSKVQGSPASLGGAFAPWQSPLGHSASLKRQSSLRSAAGNGTAPAANGSAAAEEVIDRHTLLGLKSAFEQLHLVRRRALCHLLALDFSVSPSAMLSKAKGSAKHLDGQEYWNIVADLMNAMATSFDDLKQRMTDLVAREMSGEFQPGTSDAEVKDGQSPEKGRAVLPQLPGSTGLLPFTGFEDHVVSLASRIRSIQVKLRACAEELQIGHPPALHGTGTSSDASDAGGARRLNEAEIAARKENAERVWESLKEDIVSVTQEWESGGKILRTEKRRGSTAATREGSTGSTGSSLDNGELSRDRALTPLESPQEADEDAVEAGKQRRRFAMEEATELTSNGETSDETDLTALLLRTTSPHHLPPPGLEQVFESIAGLAGALDEDVDGGRKLTREERIRRVKEQREEAKKRQDGVKSNGSSAGQNQAGGVVTELKDVLDQLRQKRLEAANGQTEPPTNVATAQQDSSTAQVEFENHPYARQGNFLPARTTTSPAQPQAESKARAGQLAKEVQAASGLGSPFNPGASSPSLMGPSPSALSSPREATFSSSAPSPNVNGKPARSSTSSAEQQGPAVVNGTTRRHDGARNGAKTEYGEEPAFAF